MNVRIVPAITAGVLAITALMHSGGLTPAASAQTNPEGTWSVRTSWGDPDLQGEWTSEGEYGVPFERPTQFGTRQFMTDAEYAERIEEVRVRDERDLAPVDVLSGKVDAPNAPIPHWREYNTTSRRTSLIIDPPDGRLPRRVPQARPVPVQRCGSLQRGEPCDSYDEVRPRRPLHRAWRRLSRRDVSRRLQRQHAHHPEHRYRRDHVRADSRHAHHHPRPVASASDAVVACDSDLYGCRARALGRDDPGGGVEQLSGEHTRGNTRSASHRAVHSHQPGRHSVSGHVRGSGDVGRAVDRRARSQVAAGGLGCVRYACHEGNYGMFNMLSASRHLER